MKTDILIADRFEGGFAVCEREDGTMVDVDMKLIPDGTEEGDVLRVKHGVYAVDTQATAERTQRIRRLMDELWKEQSW